MTQTNEEKRNNLLHSAGKLQVGRRGADTSSCNDTKAKETETQPAYIRERNKATIRGLLLGAIVVIAAIVVLMVVGNSVQIAG